MRFLVRYSLLLMLLLFLLLIGTQNLAKTESWHFRHVRTWLTACDMQLFRSSAPELRTPAPLHHHHHHHRHRHCTYVNVIVMVAGRPQNSFWTSCQFLGPGVPGFSGYPYFHHFMCQRKFAFFRWFGRLCNWIFHGELLGHDSDSDSDSDSCHLLLLMHPRSGFLFVFFLFPAVGFLDLQSLRIVQPLLSAHCQQQRDSHLDLQNPAPAPGLERRRGPQTCCSRAIEIEQHFWWDLPTFRFVWNIRNLCALAKVSSARHTSWLALSVCYDILIKSSLQAAWFSHPTPSTHSTSPHPRIPIIPDPPRSLDPTNINDFSCGCADAPLRRCWNIYAACDIVAWH